MPLTTYASTLILMGPSRVWKYKSILTYLEMEAFPVTWTKLNHCPCQSLMGVCISESDFCEIRVMSDPALIITLVRFLLRKLMVARTWAAWEPRKEHPWGHSWCFLISTSGLEPGDLSKIEWWTLLGYLWLTTGIPVGKPVSMETCGVIPWNGFILECDKLLTICYENPYNTKSC